MKLLQISSLGLLGSMFASAAPTSDELQVADQNGTDVLTNMERKGVLCHGSGFRGDSFHVSPLKPEI